MAETRHLYFAYGSNFWWPRMRQRCPGARAWDAATLDGYRLVERLYADVERRTGAHVQDVLYAITAADLAALDRFEGLAGGVYRRVNVKVRYGRRTYDVCTYLMNKETRAARRGEALSRVVQEHLLDGRAVARPRGRVQGQEHKRLVAGLPCVGPDRKGGQ